MTWDDNITLVLTNTEAVTLSAVILTCGHAQHRTPTLESVRRKLRAQLNHRLRDKEEEEAQLALLAATYAHLEAEGL